MVSRLILYGTIGAALAVSTMIPVSEPAGEFVPVFGVDLIAHAGGGLPGATYSNSREAFDLSAENGFTLIEVDFELTESGDLVLLHGWEDSHYRYFSRVPRLPRVLRDPWPDRAKTAEDFTAREMRQGLTPMTAADLLVWMDRHPDVRIVTDTKGDNGNVLSRLADLAGDGKLSRFIPQIYAPDELSIARELGYVDIIFTAYKSDLSLTYLATLAETENLFALTLPWQRVIAISEDRLPSHIPVYAHTVNDLSLAKDLEGRGVDGLYTDYLTPSSQPMEAGSASRRRPPG